MSRSALAGRARRTVSYWPHAGLALGMLLNGLGLVTKDTTLIATASNLLVICGLFLGQRKRNEKRGE
jgi:hypothetical protein